MGKLTGKKAAFVDEYTIDMNQTRAAIRAGYSSKTAASAASRLMKDPAVKAAIDEWRARRHAERTADAEEVIEFWTAVMRGEITEATPIYIGGGEQDMKETAPAIRDRIAAAKELGKLYSLDKGISREDEQESGVRAFLDAVRPAERDVAETFDE